MVFCFSKKDTGAHHRRTFFFFSTSTSSSRNPFTTAAPASASAATTTTRLDPVSGRNLDGPDLSCSHPSGLLLPNPFVIGSGPPGTNRAVMRRAFLEGWGAVIAKTVSLDASKVVNVTPRYSKVRFFFSGFLSTPTRRRRNHSKKKNPRRKNQ